MKKVINHQNWIRDNINFAQFGPPSDREIYCRKLHKITEPLMSDCGKCSYMAGWMGGNGHECVWEDIVPDDLNDDDNGALFNRTSEWETRDIPWKDRKKELARVSKLIDQGLLEK